MRQLLIAVTVCALLPSVAQAEDLDRDARLKTAIERGLAVVTRGAKSYPEHRKCFSCHHQTLPMFALATAREARHKIDEDVFSEQLKFTQAFFAGRRDSLARGERIGGAAATVAYGLWTYQIADAAPDEVTDALVTNLIKLQAADGHWEPPSVRPPLEESHVSCTVLAGYALQVYGRGEQQKAAEAAFDKAGKWLADAKLESTEDHTFALFWHACFQPDEARAAKVAKSLLELQRDDGGWGQTPAMASDAYATGQALFVLTLNLENAGTEQYQKGVEYLLSTQQADGSWHVKTRSKPVQKYFDNGDPHGADQFISMAATSWATVGLATQLVPFSGNKSP